MWFNGIMRWLISSPLHFFVSKNMMLLTYTGRKSGKTYTTPVNYWHDGAALMTVSLRERTWWRNLRGGAPVTVRLQGKDVTGTAVAHEDDATVTHMLQNYLQQFPQMAKYFDVALDAKGEPVVSDISTAAQSRVFVATQLQ